MGFSVLFCLVMMTQPSLVEAAVTGSWIPVPVSRHVSLPDSIDPDDGEHPHLIFIESRSRMTDRVQRRRRLPWELSYPVDQAEIHRSIQDPRVKDVVILAKGLPTGQLIDDFGDPLPRDFFQKISPGLRSLSFYGCGAEQSIEFYRINRLFKTRKSIHTTRAWMVSDGFCSGEDPGFIPDQPFPHFMKQVERELRALSRLEEPELPLPPEDPGEALCAIQFFDFPAERISVFLNGHFLGVARFQQGSRLILGFSCAWLRTENHLQVRVKEQLGSLSEMASPRIEPLLPGLQVTRLRVGWVPDTANQPGHIGVDFGLELQPRWFPFTQDLLRINDRKVFF